jgi:hypothetical protein
VGPWSPDWRPDLTGGRLLAIRAARRGALAAAVGFAVAVAIASMLAPELEIDQPAPRLVAALIIAVGSMPGLGLLGAALTSAARDDRTSAAVAAMAIGIAAPTAAVASAMIGVFVTVSFVAGIEDAAEVAGMTLQAGVRAAIRVAPLIGLLSIAWVAIVRRWVARPAT